MAAHSPSSRWRMRSGRKVARPSPRCISAASKSLDSIAWITGHLGLAPELRYAGGERGWVGDSPFIFLDCARMRSLGWKPELTIQQGIIRTLEYLRSNPWVLESRA